MPPCSRIGASRRAARACAVGYKTLLRWMKEPEFDAEYRAAKRATFGQSIARMHHLCGAAVSTLGKVMLDLDTPRFHKGPRRSAWPIQAADETQSAGGLGQERDETDHQTACRLETAPGEHPANYRAK